VSIPMENAGNSPPHTKKNAPKEIKDHRPKHCQAHERFNVGGGKIKRKERHNHRGQLKIRKGEQSMGGKKGQKGVGNVTGPRGGEDLQARWEKHQRHSRSTDGVTRTKESFETTTKKTS